MQTPRFETRSIVLIPEDLTLSDWHARAARAGLTTLSLHGSPGTIRGFAKSAEGERFLEQCRLLDLKVEYALHAMRELLPRSLFDREPDLFRMNESGERTPDANLCVHAPRALEIVAEEALRFAEAMRPETGRHFFWGDDGAPWCRCPQCRPFSDSDQALIMNNYLAGALRRWEPQAKIAHLAYALTLPPPARVRPVPGVFLEFAPFYRRYDTPYEAQTAPEDRDPIALLDANLAVFGAEDAQILEYWLDVSRFSGWKRPAVRLPWHPQAFAADLDSYERRGIRHIACFAVYIDAEYLARYGEPPLPEYGAMLLGEGRGVHPA